MSFQQTLEQLRGLKLHAMARAFEEQRANSDVQALAFEERLALGVECEIQERENRRRQSREKKANLKSQACPEDIDYHTPRGLNRKVMQSLLTCDFVQKSLNVLITGPTGVGKSWLGKALGRQAIRKGFTVRCERLEPMLIGMEIARGDGSLLKLRAELAKTNLLILDDWGMPSSLTARNRQDLMELVEDRTDNGATLITSQLPVDNWHEYIGEPTIADAILDRLIHKAHRIELRGESMRKQQALPLVTSEEE